MNLAKLLAMYHGKQEQWRTGRTLITGHTVRVRGPTQKKQGVRN